MAILPGSQIGNGRRRSRLGGSATRKRPPRPNRIRWRCPPARRRTLARDVFSCTIRRTAMRRLILIFWDAWLRFTEDDGWAIASHIALTILTSLFPVLIFVTALAGFFGTVGLAGVAARFVFAA